MHILFHQCPLCIFKTEPLPVSGLQVTFKGVTAATLAWKNSNGTDTSRMLLEATGSHEELNRNLAVNISDLKPGIKYKATLCVSESNNAQRDLRVGEHGSGELQECASRLLASFAFQ